MKTPLRVDAALKRLSSALDQLEAAQSRRQKADLMRSDLSEELVLMQDDRSRLAVELDSALARAKALETANREAAQRLGSASAVIRSVLATIETIDDE
jgi:chromosome segregation ATPase